MARRKVAMNEIVELIYHWHQGSSIKGIQRSLKFARKTIRNYIRLAQQLGVRREQPFPDEQELIKGLRRLSRAPSLYETPALDSLAPFRDKISHWLQDDHITAKQIWRLLREEHALSVGYSTVKRYLRREFAVGAPTTTVRIETPPGQQAQVDFGYAGLMYDPVSERQRRAWAFIMTLSYSRHRFVRFVFRMDAPSWIDCHIRAFQHFDGLPATIVLDNLKPGVIKADIYDPILNRGYADLERHYGFVTDPATVNSPKLKGKVERMVPVVRQHLLAGRSFKDIHEANQRALSWSKHEIGQEIHGTTKRKPYPVFLEEEKSTLTPLPAEPFEIPLWKECTVHPDHHVVFDRAYYSLPSRYIGRKLWVRGTHTLVRIFSHQELIKTHRRARYPGERVTDLGDYPPEKLAYLMATPSYVRRKAAEYGPHTEKLIRTILSDHAMRNLRKAQGILRLAEKHGRKDIERACERALSFGNYRYRSIKTILERGLSMPEDSPSPPPLSALGQRFLRPAASFRREVKP